MNKAECKELLVAISAIDNRKITQETLDGWSDILRNIPLDVALEAHRMARKSEAVGYLEPKHIVSYAREAAFALDRDKPKPAEREYVKVPQPTCKAHGKLILECVACCRDLSKMNHLTEAGLLAWAKQNIYA
jgi:hypothetical protein